MGGKGNWIGSHTATLKLEVFAKCADRKDGCDQDDGEEVFQEELHLLTFPARVSEL